MDAKGWKKKIKKQCETLGTMRDEFIPVIDALAGILEDERLDQHVRTHLLHLRRHGVHKAEQRTGRAALLLVHHPDLNNQALTFYRDLGLTPAGLKKLNDNALKVEKKTSFAEVLANIGI